MSYLLAEIEKALFGLPYTLPTGVDAYYTRAQLFLEQGHASAALSIFDRRADADHPHLPSLYAGAELRIGRKVEGERAVTALTRYIELTAPDVRPSRAAAW